MQRSVGLIATQTDVRKSWLLAAIVRTTERFGVIENTLSGRKTAVLQQLQLMICS